MNISHSARSCASFFHDLTLIIRGFIMKKSKQAIQKQAISLIIKNLTSRFTRHNPKKKPAKLGGQENA